MGRVYLRTAVFLLIYVILAVNPWDIKIEKKKEFPTWKPDVNPNENLGSLVKGELNGSGK